MTASERDCRRAWLAAMTGMLSGCWYGFRSERDALRRARDLLDYELSGRR